MADVQKKLSKGKSGDKQFKQGFELRKCSWGDVLAEAQSIASSWKTRPGKQTKTMAFIDKVGTHSNALEAWIGLLPMGDYGSRYAMSGTFSNHKDINQAPKYLWGLQTGNRGKLLGAGPWLESQMY